MGRLYLEDRLLKRTLSPARSSPWVCSGELQCQLHRETGDRRINWGSWITWRNCVIMRTQILRMWPGKLWSHRWVWNSHTNNTGQYNCQGSCRVCAACS
jgi:hypothetical protein